MQNLEFTFDSNDPEACLRVAKDIQSNKMGFRAVLQKYAGKTDFETAEISEKELIFKQLLKMNLALISASISKVEELEMGGRDNKELEKLQDEFYEVNSQLEEAKTRLE